jgi:hypothetical protein
VNIIPSGHATTKRKHAKAAPQLTRTGAKGAVTGPFGSTGDVAAAGTRQTGSREQRRGT